MGGREERRYTPVIGLSFISNARSLLASCHSLVSVFGGGAATKKYKSKRDSSQQREGGGGVTRTELFKSEEKHACNTDEGECAEEDLEVVAGLAGGCAWAVRAKGYVVCCLGGVLAFVRSVRRGQHKTRKKTGQTSPSKPRSNDHTIPPFQHPNNQSKKLTSFFLIKRQFLPILLLQNLKLFMNSHLFLTRQLSPLRLDV